MKRGVISFITAVSLLMSLIGAIPVSADYIAAEDTYTWDFAEYATAKTGAALGTNVEDYQGLTIRLADNNANDTITTAGVKWNGGGSNNENNTRYIAYTPKANGTLYVTASISGSNRWGIKNSVNAGSFSGSRTANDNSIKGSGTVDMACSAATTYYILSQEGNPTATVSKVWYVLDEGTVDDVVLPAEPMLDDDSDTVTFNFTSNDVNGTTKVTEDDIYKSSVQYGYTSADGLTVSADGSASTSDVTFNVYLENGNYDITLDTTAAAVSYEQIPNITYVKRIKTFDGEKKFTAAVCDEVFDITIPANETITSLSITKQAAKEQRERPALFAVGDSTVNTTETNSSQPERGASKTWGVCVDDGNAALPSNISAFYNCGQAGANTITYYNDYEHENKGHLDDVLLNICPGDYVTVNLGINNKRGKEKTGTADDISDTSAYTAIVRDYILKGIIQRGGIPIVLTATPHGPIDSYTDRYSDGVFSCERTGSDARTSSLLLIASSLNIPVLNVGAWGNDYFNSISEAEAKAAGFDSVLEYVQSMYIDHNHYKETLGTKIASYVLSSVASIIEGEKEYASAGTAASVTAEVNDAEKLEIDTSSMPANDNVKQYEVTLSKNGKMLRSSRVPAAAKVYTETVGADKVDVGAVYRYENVSDVSAGNVKLGDFESGLYNITFQKNGRSRCDIYVNGTMVGNNIDQSGAGRSPSSGSAYTANNIKVTEAAKGISVQTLDFSGSSKITKFDYVEVVKAPESVERRTKVFVIGDSLVANYYGGNESSYLGTTQTGWGQTLPNFVNTDNYEVVNLANSGEYAKSLYETAFPGVIANSEPGDILIFEAGYNDKAKSTEAEMTEYIGKAVDEAKAANIIPILVNPNATPEEYNSVVKLGDVMRSAADDKSVEFIDLSKLSYGYLYSVYGDDENSKASLKATLALNTSDDTHSSYLGAMKYASIIAGEMYNSFKNNETYKDLIDTDYTYEKADGKGNTVICNALETIDTSDPPQKEPAQEPSIPPISDASASAPTGLLTNELEEPLNAEEPTFGWIVNGDGENIVQTAYQIVVTDEITGDVAWNSGKVLSSEQSYITCGEALQSGHPYSWKVRTWLNSAESPSDYSEAAYFATGIADWGSTAWISDGTGGATAKEGTYNHFWYARKSDTLDTSKTVKKAMAYISGLQDYDLYVNNTEIGRGQSFDYASESRYQGWDITDAVKSVNDTVTVGALVRTYGGGQGRAAVNAALLGYINIFYTDGTAKTIVTDKTWKVSKSVPFSGTTRRNGEGDFVENYNAQNARENFTSADFNDSSWTAASDRTVDEEISKVIPELSKPTSYEAEPVSIEVLSDGTTVADFGTVIPARPSVTFKNGTAGKSVTIQGGYMLGSDGKVNTSSNATQSTNMTWTYVEKAGEQTYNAWDHLGFRYLQIPSCGETFTKETLRARIVHTNVPQGRGSTFTSSNEMLDNVYELMKRSAIYGVQNEFVDTPTREKGQFTDDSRNISEATMSTQFEREASKKAIDQFLASADRYWTGDEAGRYNSVYPNVDGKRDIPEYSVNIPQWVWNYYMHTGDKAMLKKAYPYIKATADYISANIKDSGLVERLAGGDGSPNAYQYGIVDWPEPGRFGYDWSGTKQGARTTVNMLSKHAFDVVSLAAAELGYDTDEADMKARSAALTEAINAKLINDEGLYVDGTNGNGNKVSHVSQHANSFALAFDVVSDSNKDKVAEYVAEQGMRQGPMTADILVKGLFNAGKNTAALKLFTEPLDYGWAKEVANGFTFTWESWMADGTSRDDSQSHAWGSTATSDILRNFAGVQNLEPGAKKVKIAPVYTDLTSLDAKVSTERGFVGVKYERDNTKFDITVTVPANVQAQIELPVIGDGEFKRTNGTLTGTKSNAAQIFNAGSGTYSFSYDGNITVLPEKVVYDENTDTDIYSIVGLYSEAFNDQYKGSGSDYKMNDLLTLHFGNGSTSISSSNGMDLYNDGSYIMLTPEWDGKISIDVKMRKAGSRIYLSETQPASGGTSLHDKVSSDTEMTISDIEVKGGTTYYIYNDVSSPTSIKSISYTYPHISLEGIKGVSDAASNIYTWQIGNANAASAAGETYSDTSDYVDLTVSLGAGDSMSEETGTIKLSDSSVGESNSLNNTKRYILVKPKYSGTFSMDIAFSAAGGSTKNRIYYADLGTETEDIDLTAYKKGSHSTAGSDITSTSVQTRTIDMTAGHTYIIYTYQKSSTISALSYTYTDKEIEVTPDGLDKKYMHVSFDDVYACLKDITDKANEYDSVFNNSFLGELKTLHETYGAVFTLNCFIKTTKDSSYDISNLPDKYAKELAANSDWLKFAFHAQDDNAIYGPTTGTSSGKQASADEARASYKKFTDAVMTATGNNKSSIDTVTRLGFFSGNEENIAVLSEGDYGITGLLTADDSRLSYYFDNSLNSHVNKYGYHYDSDKKLKLIKTITRFEGNKEVSAFTTAALDNYAGNMIEVFTHESEYSKANVKANLIAALEWAKSNNCGFDYAMYLIEPKSQRSYKPDEPVVPIDPENDKIQIISEETEDGKIYYTVKVNGYDKGTLISAVYNSDNSLYSVDMYNLDGNLVPLTVEAPNADTAKVKFMLWDGIDTMAPLEMLEHTYNKPQNEDSTSSIALNHYTYPLVVGNSSKTDFSRWEDQGSSFTLSAAVDSGSASNVTWEIEDSSIAYIRDNVTKGESISIRGKRTGVTKATATAPNGDKAECVITVIDNVTRETVQTLDFNTNKLALAPGMKATLVPIINPKDVYGNGVLNTDLTWESSDANVAAVSNGIVTAKAAGTAIIKAISADVGRTAECEVTVSADTAVQTIAADTSYARTMTAGQSAKLTAEGDNISWKSDDPLIADVNEDGIITAYSNSRVPKIGSNGQTIFENGMTAYDLGTVKIYATSPTGDTKTFLVKVADADTKASSVNIYIDNPVIASGKTRDITAAVLPAREFGKTVTWSSSDTSVAAVADSGKTVYGVPKATITGVSAGKAVITASCDGKTDTVEITVTGSEVKVSDIDITNVKEIDIDEVYGLDAKVTADAANKELAFISTDNEILTVNNEGIVKGYKAGTAKVYAVAMDSVTDKAALNSLLDKRTIGSGSADLSSFLSGKTYKAFDVTVKDSSPYLRNLHAPAEGITDSSVNLLWNRASLMDTGDFASYNIYNGDSKIAENITALGYTVNYLKPDTEYVFKVQAVTADGRELAAETIDVTTDPKSPVINVLSYGANGDGIHPDTIAIQNAIDDCSAGGTVLLPEGYVFMSGALYLKSDMTFKVDGILLGSPYDKDYPATVTRWEGWRRLYQTAEQWGANSGTDGLTENVHPHASLINAGTYDEGTASHTGAYNIENLTICGKGQINANGFRLGYNEGLNQKTGNGGQPEPMTPAMNQTVRGRAITIHNADKVYIKDVTVSYSPSWTIHPIFCRNLTVDGVEVVSAGDGKTGAADDITILNGDGIDPDSSTMVNLFNMDFQTGDDGVAIKTGKDREGNEIDKPCAYIRVTDCYSHDSKGGVVIGSENASGTHDILFQNLKVGKTTLNHTICIKGCWSRGGVTHDLLIRDIDGIDKFDIQTTYNTPTNNPADTVPQYKYITFENCNVSFTAVGFNHSISGLSATAKSRPETYLENFTIRGCQRGGSINYAKDFTIWDPEKESSWSIGSNTQDINFAYSDSETNTRIKVKTGAEHVSSVDNDSLTIIASTGTTKEELLEDITAQIPDLTLEYELSGDGKTLTVRSKDGSTTAQYAVYYATVWNFSKYTTEIKLTEDGVADADYNGLKIALSGNGNDSDHDKITTDGVYWRGGASSGESARYISYTPADDGVLTVTGKVNANSGRLGISDSLIVTSLKADASSITSTSETVFSKECKAGTTYYILPKDKSATVTSIAYAPK